MVSIDGNHLTIEDVISVARFGVKVSINDKGYENIRKAYKIKEDVYHQGKPVYGINTGFGIFANRKIPGRESAKLSRNLILSHAVATGEPFSSEIVRAAMLIRANTLCKGYSGVCVEIVETIISMLNAGVTPEIPSQGSLGSSGDLSPLSHFALVFTTDNNDLDEESGFAFYQGLRYSGKEAMAKAGIPRLALESKEGLAITNGATFSAAIAALCLHDASSLLKISNISLAMSLEALAGCSSAFDERVHQVRGMNGQKFVAKLIRQYIKNSELVDSSDKIQDAYSLRCAPQVQGIAWDTLNFIWNIIDAEINAATDNPLLFDPHVVISGGNFHGEPIGVAMDFLSIVMSEIGAISERRINRMIDGNLNNGLPPMLVDNAGAAGLNSGLMMPQYTAAALVLENQALSSPDSVLSIPTSGSQEDHNANAMNASKHVSQIIKNVQHILAIELYTASRALDLRLRMNPGKNPGIITGKVHQLIRKHVPFTIGDAWWFPEIENVKELVIENKITELLDDVQVDS